MKEESPSYRTRPFEADDAGSGFRCGKHSLDDYFRRHAEKNDSLGIGRTFVLARADEDAELPAILGYYTLSMAVVRADEIEEHFVGRLPRYPLPVALIGRLAVDERARGRRLGEALLLDALARVVHASHLVGCVGVIVDALDAEAEAFYAAYDFDPVGEERWPRRMFLPLATIEAAIGPSSRE